MTNSPAKERNNPADELGGSYIQAEDNAEIVMNNLGIECMVTIHENSIKTEIPPDGPRCSTVGGKKHALKKYDQFALNTSCF